VGFRLSKIYTRTGDKGETGMADGSRVAKDHAQVCAIGDIDELNSQIGLLIAEISQPDMQDKLNRIQHMLFDLGAELTMPEYVAIEAAQVTFLEQYLDALNENLKPLDEFILPGGCRSAAVAHVARSVCRRAERSLVSLSHKQTLNNDLMAYVNRLSDLLFVIARQCCVDAGVPEVYWVKGRSKE
jgi:cob(I)alamin adenosyltransferase